MAQSAKQCPKCSGKMIEGFLVTRIEMCAPTEWHPGKAQGSFFFPGLKISKGDLHRISTYRCSECAYLESYADGGEPA